MAGEFWRESQQNAVMKRVFILEQVLLELGKEGRKKKEKHKPSVRTSFFFFFFFGRV
jgi:hypothetical protein